MQKDILRVNPKSNIAIATLWTRKEIVAKKIGKEHLEKVNIIGTLYSIYGINFVIHTLAHTPNIDTLIIFGADLSGSGEALIKLFHEKKIVPGLRLLWNIDHIRRLLDSIEIIDLREEFRKGNWKALLTIIEEKFSPGKFSREIIPLEIKEPIGVSSWNHQLSGHYLFEYSLFRAWVKLLETIMSYGYVKETDYGEKQKQFLNIMTVIGVFSKSYKLDEEFFEIFSPNEFENHVKSLLSTRKEEGVSYTYGERLFKHPIGDNQFEAFIDKLSENEKTRRAIMITWDYLTDSTSKDPPCLILVQGDLSGKYYNHTAYFRSHDVYSAWPLNAYGQIMLASLIAEKLSEKLKKEIDIGYVTILSSSAHIYEHDWKNVKEILEKYGEKVFKAFVADPRGNFIVKVKDGEIVVEHRDWEGVIINIYRDSDPVRLVKKMRINSLLSMPEHAAYLAREIFRAYFALKEGKDYIQDRV